MGVAVGRRLLRLAIDLLYPPQCVGCGRWGTMLCAACLARADAERPASRCANCDAWWEAAGFCPRCLPLRQLDGIRAAFEYTGVARRAVHELKFRFVRALAAPMAAAMAERLALDRFDAVVPVPVHRSRERWRGFNQAAELARRLPLPPVPGRLYRARRTRPQVGLPAAERRRNVAGAFVYEGSPLDGLRLALVDDVVTSGATVDECAAVLREAGAVSVTAVAFARASYRTGSPEEPIRVDVGP